MSGFSSESFSDNRKSAIQNPKWLGLWVFIFMLTVSGAVAQAQQPGKIPRIGYLTNTPLSADPAPRNALLRGLRELGYVEGKDIIFEGRSGERSRDRQRAVAAELVHLKVAVIVAGGSGDIRAAKEATTRIPIVMVNGGDVIGSGFVVSLARPGGNITGLATLRPELSGKRLELLKEIVPRLSRVAVFASPGSGDQAQILKELELAAGPLAVKLHHIEIRSPQDFEAAFQAAAKERSEAVLVRIAGPILSPHRKEIAELAVKSRLPAIYEDAQEVEAGGLLSYGVNDLDLYRRAAIYVDKILKGAKPAELPVEQPTKFELIVNLKTAKQLSLTIPPNVLARADKVIK
jgi:putative tryptophan/tyrosine transport system substrate-binding protein